MNPFISIHSLSKSYTKGKTTVTPLENLSLDVPQGEFLALMGPSGSGKTTLLNLIAGIDSPTMGELMVDGRDIAGLSRSAITRWRAHHVGYIFQLYHLIPILSAYENVELPLLLGKFTKAQRREKSMPRLTLSDYLIVRTIGQPSSLAGRNNASRSPVPSCTTLDC